MRNLCIKTVVFAVLLVSGSIGAQDRVDLALEKLSHKHSQIRLKAAEELGTLAPMQDQVIEALRKAMSDEDHDVRSSAVLALYRMGPEAVEKAGLMGHTGYDPIEPPAAVDVLEQAWTLFNTEYPMFVMRKQLDWGALRHRYLAQARTAQSTQEVAIILTQMLRHLRDAHVWVKLKGKNLPVFKALAELNVNKNTRIYEGLLGRIQPVGRQLMWAKTRDKIGWIMFPRWEGADLPERFDEVMEQMRDTRALIVDVRWNGGGDAELSKYIASRFVDKTRVYSHYQYRNGPERTALTQKIAQRISPRGPWTYDRPVILLMGQGCVSACESFCAMMAACPTVTTMGDHTRGSTGFPVPFKLAQEIEIHVPQWIVTLPNGQRVEGQGVIPDIAFTPRADSFTEDRDALLSMALERLRQESSLPAQAIQGPSFQAAREKEEAEKERRPKLVSVDPKEGANNVAADTALRLRYDRPMHPSMLQLAWQAGGFHRCGPIQYDPENFEFTIPISLQPGCKQQLTINPPEPGVQKGFQSIHRTEANTQTWTFTTQAQTQRPQDNASSPAASRPGRTRETRSVIERFNKTRRDMWALVETVKTLEYSRPGAQGYQGLRAYTTKFTLNGQRALCADVGEKRGMPLLVFNEGNLNHISGYYQKTPEQEEIVFCLDADVTERKIAVADPFQAHNPNVNGIVSQLGLQYAGQETLCGRACDIVGAGQDQWWMDQQSHLLVKTIHHQMDGTKVISAYAYEHINEPLNFMAYMPDVSYPWVCAHKQMVSPLDQGAHRFIEIQDGTSGPVDVKWGKQTAQGRESVSL